MTEVEDTDYRSAYPSSLLPIDPSLRPSRRRVLTGTARLDANGRISIPSAMRRFLLIAEGSTVLLDAYEMIDAETGLTKRYIVLGDVLPGGDDA